MSVPSAIHNAVLDALDRDTPLPLPLTPARVWELMQMKPAPFRYQRVESLDEALAVLDEYGDEVSVLAGGQSLVPLLNLRQRRPAIVLDITRLPGLADVSEDEHAMAVGALVTQYDLGERDGIDDALRECLPYTGHYATRHRGTIGGSIAHGEPRGELPLTLLGLWAGGAPG